MKKRIEILAAAVALLCSCGGSGTSSADIDYPVRTATSDSTVIETSYPATIKGVQDVEIRPKVSGFITEIRVHEGQPVSRGQVLFVIDNETYKAAMNQAEAAVVSAEASLSTAQLTYDNSQKLFDNNVIGSYELSSAKNACASAEAALAQAKANYAAAKQNYDFCFVTSPANGVVGELPYKVGALVSASDATPLTSVADISTMQVYFSMTEKAIIEMTRTGSGASPVEMFPPITLQLADGTLYDHVGTVAAVSGVIDQATGSVLVRADFSNAERLLKSGGAGNVLLPHTATDIVIIPQTAVVEVQTEKFIYVVNDDNTVTYTAIGVDPNDDGINYIVTSGLTPGERYVTTGVTSLTDGKQINPLTEEEYAAKIAATQAMGANQVNMK